MSKFSLRFKFIFYCLIYYLVNTYGRYIFELFFIGIANYYNSVSNYLIVLIEKMI